MARDSEKNICSVNYCIELVPYDVFYSPLVDFKCVVRIFISVQTSDKYFEKKCLISLSIPIFGVKTSYTI